MISKHQSNESYTLHTCSGVLDEQNGERESLLCYQLEKKNKYFKPYTSIITMSNVTQPFFQWNIKSQSQGMRKSIFLFFSLFCSRYYFSLLLWIVLISHNLPWIVLDISPNLLCETCVFLGENGVIKCDSIYCASITKHDPKNGYNPGRVMAVVAAYSLCVWEIRYREPKCIQVQTEKNKI